MILIFDLSPDDGVDSEDDVEQVVLPQHEGLQERMEEDLDVAPFRYLPEQGGLRLTLLSFYFNLSSISKLSQTGSDCLGLFMTQVSTG